MRTGKAARHPTPETSDVIAEFGARLRDARAALVRTAATTEEELATVAGVSAPRDSAVLHLAADTLSRLADQEQHELAEIDAAEARLAAGAFGVCETCGKEIARARLRARPTARLCMRCQSRDEAAR
jgi:RNA polymerase-binding transcription factor